MNDFDLGGHFEQITEGQATKAKTKGILGKKNACPPFWMQLEDVEAFFLIFKAKTSPKIGHFFGGDLKMAARHDGRRCASTM